MLEWLKKQIESGEPVSLELVTEFGESFQGGVVAHDAVGVVILDDTTNHPYMLPWTSLRRARVHIG